MQVGNDHAAIFDVDLFQRVHDDLGVHRIEAGNRLIGQNDLGVLHQGARNRHPLLLATRQRLGPFRRLLGDAQTVENIQSLQDVGAGPDVEHGLQCAPTVQDAVQHVRGHIHAWHQIELLKDHRALALPCPCLGTLQRQHVATIHQDLARRGIREPVHHAQKGRLARTRAANDTHKGRPVDGEAGAVHCGLGAEHPRNRLNFQHETTLCNLGCAGDIGDS